MMIVHLCQTPPNMSSIGALCDRLGKTFLTFLLGNLGATGGLRVNSSPAYNLSFVPADESAILPMTAKEACARPRDRFGLAAIKEILTSPA